MTDETKMSQKTIKNNLEAIEKKTAFLQTLIEKTSLDNTNLSIGDQLRPTEDYNGSLFEVVREPYWCYIDDKGKAVNIQTVLCEQEFVEEREHADDLLKRLESQRVDNEDDYHLGVIGNPWIKQGTMKVYEGEHTNYDDFNDENEKIDADGNFYIEVPTYTVCWHEKRCPAGVFPQKRVWLRKICIISKAEGQTDDKNCRALPFPLRTIPFQSLISKELQKLDKISKTMSAIQENGRAKRTMANRRKFLDLLKLWADPTLKSRPVTGFYSEKYGLFLKSAVSYEVSTRTVNPLTKLIDDVKQISDTKNVS